jgi:hypothetical protein
MISGTTSHRLYQIKTYNKNKPYVVGLNGVTNIEYGEQGEPIKVFYTIDNIEYETNLEELNQITTDRLPLSNIEDGSKFNAETVFKTNTPSSSNFFKSGGYFFKEETKMGLVEPIKTEEQIFIERQYQTVLEKHSRLSEIKSLEGLITYRNGYYRIKSDF